MARRGLERDIAGIAALGEPARRLLYFYVVDRGGAVSREAAARGVGISRALAAFHLDKLVDAGLLVVEYRRLTGRTGPGAGRPAKLYRRSPDQVAVSLPPRSYALAADLFAQALERSPGGGGRALAPVARGAGRRLGRVARERTAGGGARGASRERLLAAAMELLASLGFEPVRTPGEVRLRNCPFHALAERHRALVCGANLALLEGVLAGLGAPGIRAALDPQPGMCCVTLRGGAVRPAAGRPARNGRRARDGRRS